MASHVPPRASAGAPPCRVAAIIPAAGRGTRLRSADAAAIPKALVELAGASLLRRCALTLQPFVGELLVAAAASDLAQVRAQLTELSVPFRVVVGGPTRRTSVERAIAELGGDAEYILVHDAARPLVPVAVVQRVLAALAVGAEVVVPAIPVADSLRRVVGAGSEVVDRAEVRAVQTPQGFRRAVLVQAHAAGGVSEATDDASLAERCGATVSLVEGDPLAFKITTPTDLILAETLASTAARLSRA